MIFVYHIHHKICSVQTQEGEALDFDPTVSIAKGLYQIANRYPNKKLVWCHLDYKESLNRAVLDRLFHHDKLLLSFRPSESNFINEAIGYVDESLFVNVNKKVTFPSWQMSSIVGMVDASVLIAIGEAIPFDVDFDYYLNSVAKLAMPLGLLCYSEPQLLKDIESSNANNFYKNSQLKHSREPLAHLDCARCDKNKIRHYCSNIWYKITRSSNYTLFRFVKQHYKTRWVFLLFLNLVIYEKQVALLPFLTSFCFRKRKPNLSLDTIKVASSRALISDTTIDVIIPTIGRKQYLYDVLKDLSKQTLLPKKVVIVEQNPDEGSLSELDYIDSESWPFEIKHLFTHQAGACHARNFALSQVESEWVFLADDDIVFEVDFFQKALEPIRKFGIQAVSISCLRNLEKSHLNTIIQWSSFGSGCSIVATSILKKCQFNLGFEFGFGEDFDFGMQLRNLGHDVLYLPEPKILHLKAPIGGFRTKPHLQWHGAVIQPKPSPTVMLSHILHKTKEQLLGYKTILLLKYYKDQKIKNPIRYFINFRKQWNQSEFWAHQLNQKA